MTYQPTNPYVTNIIPLFNVASQASGPSPTAIGLSNVQSLLTFSNKTLAINTIKSFTPNATIQLSNNTSINGDLTLNSFFIGPNNSGYSLNTCRRFIVSTPVASLRLNTLDENQTIPNFNVYINGISALDINSNGNASFANPITAPAYNVISDIRYKSNVATLKNSLSSINELNGVDYIINGVSSIGLIAQDIDLVIPSAVDKTNVDKWSIDYTQIIPHLVESIKELTNRVSILETKMKGSK